MGNFVIVKTTNEEFHFTLKAGNGETVLSSERYTSKHNCENGIASVRTNAKDDSRFDRKTSSNGKSYFNLMATNGQVIGTSQMYENEASRDIGIETVKTNAVDATIDDQTG